MDHKIPGQIHMKLELIEIKQKLSRDLVMEF